MRRVTERDDRDEESLPDLPDKQPPAPRPEGQSPPEAPPGFWMQAWSGPLPPPEHLRQFNEAVPGAGDIIIEEFREQARHRRALEDRDSRARAFALRSSAVWPPLIDALLVLGGFSAVLAGKVLIGALLIFIELIAIIVIRWVRTADTSPSSTEGSDPTHQGD